MTVLIELARLQARIFGLIEDRLGDHLPGLLARLVFAATLLPYFLNSAMTKTGTGLFGFFMIQPSAWYQIAPQAVDQALGDIDAISFFPWGLMVVAGTYAEYILPIVVVAGLASRLSALAMIGFIAVQTIVDIAVHHVDKATIGALFDRFPDSVIADQRLFWVFLLSVIVLKGGGWLSADSLVRRWFDSRQTGRKPSRAARSGRPRQAR